MFNISYFGIIIHTNKWANFTNVKNMTLNLRVIKIK